MSETISLEYGYRLPDGRTWGWTESKATRDRGARVMVSDARKVGATDYRVELLQRERKVVTGHPRVEGTVST